MKKFIALAFSAVALTGAAMAQGGPDSYNESGEATVDARAFVRVPIEVVGLEDMDLGTLMRGDQDTVVNKALFKVYADEGDLIHVWVNDGEDIVLTSLHDAEATAAAADDPDTEGPDGYLNDANGQAGAPTTMITISPVLRYRFVDNDEPHSLLWDLPTWTARNGYTDIQDGDLYGPITGLPAGIGQVNVFVGGEYEIAEDQQRGAYLGEITLTAWYDEDWAPGSF